MYIGVAGGVSRTVAILADENKETLKRTVVKPSSIRTVGFDHAMDNLQEALQNVLEGHDGHIASAFIGLGDVFDEIDAKNVRREVKKRIPRLAETPIHVKNNVLTAHAGALAGEPGIVLAAGTVSAAYADDGRGNTHMAGGFTFNEGSPGGAYDLGLQGLGVAAKALDYRLRPSAFADALLDHLKVNSFKDAIDLLEHFPSDRPAVAKLAKLVTRFADEGDSHAVVIVEKATDELLLMVRTVMTMSGIETPTLSVTGGLGNANTLFKKRFIEKVRELDSSIEIRSPLHEPAFGAVILAEKYADKA